MPLSPTPSSCLLFTHLHAFVHVYYISCSSSGWCQDWASTLSRDSIPQSPFQTVSANLTRNFSSYKPCLPFRPKQVKWFYYQHHSAIQLQYSVRPFLSTFAVFPQLLYLFTDLGFPHSFRRHVPHGITPSSRLPQRKNRYLLKDKLKLPFSEASITFPSPPLPASLSCAGCKTKSFLRLLTCAG